MLCAILSHCFIHFFTCQSSQASLVNATGDIRTDSPLPVGPAKQPQRTNAAPPLPVRTCTTCNHVKPVLVLHECMWYTSCGRNRAWVWTQPCVGGRAAPPQGFGELCHPVSRARHGCGLLQAMPQWWAMCSLAIGASRQWADSTTQCGHWIPCTAQGYGYQSNILWCPINYRFNEKIGPLSESTLTAVVRILIRVIIS